MKKRISLFMALIALGIGAQAKVRLPHLISDNMVLQQQTDARLWGWAEPGKTVKVTTSWSDQVATVKADKNGEWLVKVKTPKASYEPLSITFDDGEQLTVNNVLSGEVWVCAGQSNMEMPVKGFWMCPVKDYNQVVIDAYNQVVIDAANHTGVRSVKIPSVMRAEPQADAQCEWRICAPNTVGEFSATGYFFARTMHQALNIPIGLIEANPILNFTVKGILYYQGCSNVGDPGDQYSQRMKLLVDQWRSQFGLGEIPFYFVQIAPWAYDDGDCNAISGALLREQQYKASQIIPNSSLVCTNDLVYPYEFSQIHPTQKQQVGERLAYTALNRDYGFEGILYQSSNFKDMKIEGDAVFIHLDNNYHTDAPFEGLEGFELAGEDKVFHPATAQHFWREGGGYWDEAIRKPVAVRYCFKNFQLGNVKNGANLPLFPFRTDNW